ncbi:glycoside hydrolase family 3 C-terminal domain-containing protein [Sphingomonas sp. JC676]|uniref:glycoside hydrolase family 3 N-terminal domain-containing protein n=1 Tax=Sphingomonas sp. JC676 TaxID=2768065 RepID=UPI0016576822|nr:glycoside hydrolase family 3 N-terminal domain-containing protein [Sphingomonas sp. JC676]MBC9032965.1 glycoside hydrolase family 3 C-terminal domain-containing protein [Sphingomonas sp. JC676]
MKRRDVMKAGALLAASAWAPVAVAAQSRDHSARIKALIDQMTLAEKLGQMTQIPGGRQKSLNSKLDAAMLDRVRKGEMGSFLHVAGAEPLRELQRVAVEESRLKIPLLFAMDVIHGYRTILPVPLALAASWDPAVAEAAARLAAEEAWAAGLHWTFTPMVDVARDPRWGRVVEGAGEDPYLGARMAEAQVKGFQGADLAKGQRLMACAKHFVGYGAAIGGRDYDSADVSDRTLNEVYLPPFHAAARAGAASFMTAFNDLGGVPMTANAALVRGTLRDNWGYQGLIVSDWNAIKELINHGVAETPAQAAALALRAGVDMDMASGTYSEHLGAAVAVDAGLLPLVDQAVGRILAAKARLGLFDDPFGFGDPAHEKAPLNRPVARDLARRSIVLLRNEGGLLPLKPGAKVGLIGALADDASSTLGSWRARGQIEDGVTLRAALGDTVEYQPGVKPRGSDGSGIPAAIDAAKRADVVLLAIGEDYDFTGEARSYAEIGLAGLQIALVEALKATGKPIVAILMGGRPLALEKALTGIPAVLQTWLLGVESGPAIAEILTGKASPGGRLPIGMPRVTGQSPIPYAHLPTGRPANPDLSVDSARYRDMDIGPLFAFGHGLGYSEVKYGELSLSAAEIPVTGTLTATISITNTGKVAVEEVVQLYANDPVASVSRPDRELRGFVRVTLKPGETRKVSFTLSAAQFGIWQPGKWVVEKGEIKLMAGASSTDIRSEAGFRITGTAAGDMPATSIATRVRVA